MAATSAAAAVARGFLAWALLGLLVFPGASVVVAAAEAEAASPRSPCSSDLASASQEGGGQGQQRWRLCWPDERYGGCRSPDAGIDAVVPGTVLSSMLSANFSGVARDELHR
mmetsp:Transcript_78616/g.212708  ORF Transcript_78616/g.212708 Transcript_78616/m.212708 type:complete len:112 (-) Transcript_78616:83-418(-)